MLQLIYQRVYNTVSLSSMPVHKTVGIRGNLYVKIHILIPQLSAADLKKIKDL